MADGRMLKRAVSDSKKLPQLNTDSARLLWTWILPYLDIEGRYYADPDLIKGKVVPRLKTFTVENIDEYLKDMDRVDLITLYEIEGERYLQFRNFKEFQNLRKSKEAKSKIPPAPQKTQTKSGTTPGALPDKDGNTHLQFNLIKENLIKANISDDSCPKSVDNHIPDEENPALIKKDQKKNLMDDLKSIMMECEKLFPNQFDQQQIIVFVQSNITNKNPDAIHHCLKSLITGAKNGGVVKVRAYLEAALKIEDGKYNARDHAELGEKFKRPTGKEAEVLGEIMKRVGK